MRKASPILLVVFAALGLSMTPARAVVVYDGGAPNQFGTFYAYSPIIEAMSFSLTAGSNTFNGVNFWGGCFGGPTCGTANVTLNFYNSTGGAPGSLIDSINVGQANQTLTGLNIQTGQLPAYAEYSYSATFAPQTFTPGVTYFIGITNGGTGPSWGVENTNSLASVDYQSFDGGTTWGPTGQNAFELTASVPEPSTWAMMIIGFLGLWFIAYRRKNLAPRYLAVTLRERLSVG
jgi:hypothetical protein